MSNFELKAGSKNALNRSNPQLGQTRLPPSVNGSRASVSSAGDSIIYPMENQEYDKVSVHSNHSDSKSGGGRSKKSAGATTDTSDSSITGGSGKQIADTLVRKLIYMLPCFLALLMHVLYLAALMMMRTGEGWVLPFNEYEFSHAGPIIFEVWGALCYIVMDSALNDSLAAFLGYLLSQKDGYSIAACGFCHATLIGKVKFPNRLSFRSTAKPFLSKMSALWLVHFLMVFIVIIASTAIDTHGSRINSGALMCLMYNQNYSYPLDRGIPTIENEMGGAELIDGTALGLMRASDPTLNHSVHMIPPQLTDVCQDGSTIQGPGFQTDVHSECTCTGTSSFADLALAGVDSSLAAQYVSQLKSTPGWVNSIVLDGNAINVTTVLTAANVCGGNNRTSPAVAVCKTRIWNHQFIGALVTYKTDGTPASIAAKKVVKVDIGTQEGPANITWLYLGMEKVLGGSVSSHRMPAHWPGSVNPLLWMASQNMQDATLGLLEPGMEAAIALMMRAAIQRTYIVTGGFCTQNIKDPLTVTLTVEDWGFALGLFWVIFQLTLNILAFVAYIPWLMNPYPILPAIQAAQDHIIFSLLSSKNAVTSSRMKGMSSNIDGALMWPKLDIVLRVGESVLTAEDPERGVVLLDKPKMVTDMSYDKTYV